MTETTKEISATEWLAGGRKSTITEDGATYVLYDYKTTEKERKTHKRNA